MADEPSRRPASWSVPWERTGHCEPVAVRGMDFDAWIPNGWWFATKTRVYVRPFSEKRISITVEGVSEPISDHG